MIAVLSFSVVALCKPRPSVIDPNNSLDKRMFLLPILRSSLILLLEFVQSINNWVKIRVYADSIAGDVVPLSSGMVWDYNCFLFAFIIIYSNIKLQRARLNTIMCRNIDDQVESGPLYLPHAYQESYRIPHQTFHKMLYQKINK